MGILTAILATCFIVHRKRSHASKCLIFAQDVLMAVILYSGVVLTVYDQLVTQSILPFLIGVLILGVVYINPPVKALVWLVSAYVLLSVGMGLTQENQDILLSNRVNSFTIICLGFALSLILWNSNVENITQKRFIAEQQAQLEEKSRQLEQLAFLIR